MVSFGPAKILLVLMVALIVLGPERLPQMSRQIGKAWGDFRRFREHLESEVRGAFGEDLAQQYTPPWSPDAPTQSSLPSGAEGQTPDGVATDGASGSDSTRGETVEDRAPPPGSGQPAAGSSRPAARKEWDPGQVPDEPSLN